MSGDRSSEQGLLTRETLTHRSGARHVMALTREGKALLDAHRGARQDGRRQEYDAGVVKPRELSHDAQLYRAYRAEATRIEREGGRVTRVVLDYEPKRDYQKFLNRKDRPEAAEVRDDRQAFAQPTISQSSGAILSCGSADRVPVRIRPA